MEAMRAAALVLLASPALAQTVIDFDDAPGLPGPYSAGQPVRPAAIVDGQYLSSGVLFDSGGGGLLRSAPSNPVSSPNAVSSTEPGPVMSWAVPSSASFWLGDRPAVVDYVQLTLTNSTTVATLEAYDFQGSLLGSSTGFASAILRVDAPGAIHSAVVQQGPMAFDDFTFDGLQPIGALAVTAPRPGRAGMANELIVTGAEPFEPVLLRVEVALAGPLVAATSVFLVADAGGEARHVLHLPEALAGHRVRARVESSPWAEDVLAPRALPPSIQASRGMSGGPDGAQQAIPPE